MFRWCSIILKTLNAISHIKSVYKGRKENWAGQENVVNIHGQFRQNLL